MDTLTYKTRSRADVESAENAPQRSILEDMTNLNENSPSQRLQQKHVFSSESSVDASLAKRDCAMSRSCAMLGRQNDITSVINTPDCYKSSSSLSHSILDKQLPPKPQPQNSTREERRYSHRREDLAKECLTAKRSSSHAGGAGGESLSDMGSFNTTSSLRSAPGDTPSEVEFGIAVTKTSQHVGAHALQLGSYVKETSGHNALGSSSASLCSPIIHTISSRNSIHSRSRSLAHIATQNIGSTVVCGPVISRFARREPDETRIGSNLVDHSHISNQVVRPPIIRSTNPSASRAPFRETQSDRNPTIVDISAVSQARNNSSLSIVDVSRRSETFGTGATVRFSKDAHDVIMGRSLHNEGSSMPSRLAVISPLSPARSSRPQIPAVKASNKLQRVITPNPLGRDESYSFQAQSASGISENTARQNHFELSGQDLPGDKWNPKPASSPSLYFASPGQQPGEGKLMKGKRSPNQYSPPSQLPRYNPGRAMLSNNGTHGARLPKDAHASRNILWKYGKTPLNLANKNSLPSSHTPSAPSGKQPPKLSSKGLKGRVSAILLGRRSSGDVGDEQTGRELLVKRNKEVVVVPTAAPIYSEAKTLSKKISTSSLSHVVGSKDTAGRKISPLVRTTRFSAADLFTARSVAAMSHRSESTTETLSAPYIMVENNDSQFDRRSSKQDDNERDPFDETGAGHFFDMQLREAQCSLDRAIEACQVIEDPELKATVASAIHMAGDAILASREARMANIALSNAVAGLVKQSNCLTAAACSAALKGASVPMD